jgi:hypothetical protein
MSGMKHICGGQGGSPVVSTGPSCSTSCHHHSCSTSCHHHQLRPCHNSHLSLAYPTTVMHQHYQLPQMSVRASPLQSPTSTKRLPKEAHLLPTVCLTCVDGIFVCMLNFLFTLEHPPKMVISAYCSVTCHSYVPHLLQGLGITGSLGRCFQFWHKAVPSKAGE